MDGEDVMFCAMLLEAEYFADMTMSDGLGEAMNARLDEIGSAVHPSITGARFEISELPGDVLGQFEPETMTITLAPSVSGIKKSDLAHEMIHYYECELGRKAPNARDVIALSLYERLRSEVEDLSSRVAREMELVTRNEIEELGGSHGVLFLLKSYDIDLRLGLPLGTVHGYSG